MRAIGSPQCKIQKIRTHKKSSNSGNAITNCSNGFHDFSSTISNRLEGFEVAGYQDLYFAVQVSFP
ncbi:hypothetical protein Hanom_Chr03g00249971 [Helianthus anomalus]